MTALRTTAILKTDIRGSTERFRALSEPDLTALLAEHGQFVARLAAAHEGRIVKGEGDGYWVVFPSVTAAAQAAVTMQQELRLAQPNKGEDRLTMRIVITVGDVLEQNAALVGDAVVLAARIEALTPPDEIYMSAAARSVVNQAEVRTGHVDAFVLKGFTEPVSVYRVEHAHRTRVVTDQCIVFTDLGGFTVFSESSPVAVVEAVLDRLSELVAEVCREFGGLARFSVGDMYCLTFPEPAGALAAAERLTDEWTAYTRGAGLRCPMAVGAHKGVLHQFRSYLYGADVNAAAALEGLAARFAPGESVIFVSDRVRKDLVSTVWETRLQAVENVPPSRGLAGIDVYRVGPTP